MHRAVFVIGDAILVTVDAVRLNSWLRLWSVDPMNFMRPASLLWPLKYLVCLSPERIYFADSLLCTSVIFDFLLIYLLHFFLGVDRGRVELL